MASSSVSSSRSHRTDSIGLTFAKSACTAAAELGVSSELKARIRAVITQVEVKYNIKVLFAAESGSRAWGMASPDSDYDVRGIFVPANPARTSLERELHAPGATPVDITFFSDDRLIDVSLWDVRKAVALLGEGKTAVLEWARSPFQYMSTPGWPDQLQEIARASHGMRAATLRHYVGLMRSGLHQNLRDERTDPEFGRATATQYNVVTSAAAVLRKAVAQGYCSEKLGQLGHDVCVQVHKLEGMEPPSTAAKESTLTAKKYMYVVLPAVYITWLLQHEDQLPPLDLETALAQVRLPEDLQTSIHALLAAKRSAAEKNAWHTRLANVDAWIDGIDKDLTSVLDTVGRPVHLDRAALLQLVYEAERECSLSIST